ncbi:MAG: hypothetical protein ACP5O4_01540 [bacterium]|jgi:hypothetical protein
MELKQNKFYKIASIKYNEVLYMNYGLIENIVIKIISLSIDGNTIYIEIPDLKRKLALSKELINDLELIEVNNKND